MDDADGVEADEPAIINSFRLNDLRQKIRYCRLLQEPADDFELVVVGVFRYLKDPSFFTDTGTQPQHAGDYNDPDVYDLLLTDGNEQMKCLLSPTRSNLVQTFKLHPGSRIRLNPCDCVVHTSEKHIRSAPFVIINQLQVTPYSCKDLDLNNLPFCDASCELQTLERPLVTSRGCYMSLWNSEDLLGDCWNQPVTVAKQMPQNPLITISALAQNWKTLSRPYPTLVVRVLNRSRMHCFAKCDKLQKWPFQLQLEVADETGIVSVVGWNSLTCLLYNRVQDGSVLLLNKYTVRDRYALMTRPHDRNYDLSRFELEIVLNPNEADVQLLDPTVAVGQRLPALKFSFLTRQEMRHISLVPNANGINFDIVGVVCHVGRYMRTRKGDESSQFWMSRWVHVFDGSSLQPVQLHLFSTSQPEEHCRIVPAVILLVTQLRLIITNLQDTASPISHKREQHLTTTTSSQISVFDGNVVEPLASHPFFHDLENWRSSRDGHTIIQTSSTVAGCNSFPPLPYTLDDYKATFTDEKPLQPTPSGTIVKLLPSLAFRESERLHFLGEIVSISFQGFTRKTPCSTSDPSDAPETTSRTRSGNRDIATGSASEPSSQRRGFPLPRITQSELASVDVNPFWQRVKDKDEIQMYGSVIPHRSFFLRKYQPGVDDNVIRQSLVMPSERNFYDCSGQDLEGLPIVDSVEGYFLVTMLSVNDKIALRGFLPLSMDSGVCNPVQTSSQVEPAFLSILAGRSMKWPVNLQSKTQLERICWLMEETRQLHDRRMLFVLDAYNPGHDDQVELFINRGYLLS